MQAARTEDWQNEGGGQLGDGGSEALSRTAPTMATALVSKKLLTLVLVTKDDKILLGMKKRGFGYASPMRCHGWLISHTQTGKIQRIWGKS